MRLAFPSIGWKLGVLAGLFPCISGLIRHGLRLRELLGSFAEHGSIDVERVFSRFGRSGEALHDVVGLHLTGFACLLATGLSLVLIAAFGLRKRSRPSWILYLLVLVCITINDLFALLHISKFPFPVFPICFGTLALLFCYRNWEHEHVPAIPAAVRLWPRVVLWIVLLLPALYMILLGVQRWTWVLAVGTGSESTGIQVPIDGWFPLLDLSMINYNRGTMAMNVVASANFVGVGTILCMASYVALKHRNMFDLLLYLGLALWLWLTMGIATAVAPSFSVDLMPFVLGAVAGAVTLLLQLREASPHISHFSYYDRRSLRQDVSKP